jgi:hypothetical protein
MKSHFASQCGMKDIFVWLKIKNGLKYKELQNGIQEKIHSI